MKSYVKILLFSGLAFGGLAGAFKATYFYDGFFWGLAIGFVMLSACYALTRRMWHWRDGPPLPQQTASVVIKKNQLDAFQKALGALEKLNWKIEGKNENQIDASAKASQLYPAYNIHIEVQPLDEDRSVVSIRSMSKNKYLLLDLGESLRNVRNFLKKLE